MYLHLIILIIPCVCVREIQSYEKKLIKKKLWSLKKRKN